MNLPRMRKGMFPTILTKFIPHALTRPSDATIPSPAAITPQKPMIILLPGTQLKTIHKYRCMYCIYLYSNHMCVNVGAK